MKNFKIRSLITISVSAILVIGCGGGGGSSAPVTPPIVVVVPAPTITLSFASPKVNVGSPDVLTWTSTNATTCTGSDGLSGALLTSSSTTITPTVGGQTKYTVTCSGAGGTTVKSTDLITPIPIQRTSYLNAKNINVTPQTMPIGIGFVKDEAITAGHQFGDFFQDGTIAMVAASNIFAGINGNGSTVAGRMYFFHSDGKGGWVDQTNKLLTDRAGCISPRKVIVADFNGDGKPDIFVACHGIDGNIPSGFSQGESPRYLLSQTDGTYKNTSLNFNCYCHGAAAADFNGNGFADIVVADPVISQQTVYFKNNHDGTFTKRLDLVPASAKFKSIWSLDFVDLNNDSNFDLAVYGSENNSGIPGAHSWDIQPTIFINDGTNIFADNLLQVKLPFTNHGDIWDIIVKDSKIAVLRAHSSTQTQIEKYLYPSLTITLSEFQPEMDTVWFTLYNKNIVGSFSKNPYSYQF